MNMKSVKISKIKNGVGNYIAHYYDEEKHKWIIEAWKRYTDAVVFYSWTCGLTKETNLEKALILEIEE